MLLKFQIVFKFSGIFSNFHVKFSNFYSNLGEYQNLVISPSLLVIYSSNLVTFVIILKLGGGTSRPEKQTKEHNLEMFRENEFP